MSDWRARTPEAAFLREALLAVGFERPRLREAAAAVADWDGLLWLAGGHAVAETVWSALALRGALDAVPPGPRAALEDEHDAATARNALLLAEAAGLQAALRAEGVESVVLKGPGLLAAHYPDVGARHVADVDLLVRPADLERAAAAAALAGARPRPHGPDGGEEGASPHHLPGLSTRRGVALELHHRLPGGTADPAGVLARAREVAWQGRTLRIPSAADLAGIACAHVFETHHALGQMVPRHLADLAVLFGSGATGWAEVEALHGAGAGSRWLRASRALLDEDRATPLDAWLSTSAGRAGLLAGKLAGGWRRSPGAALRVLFPDRAYMAFRYRVDARSPWLPLLYLWRPVRGAYFVLTGR